MELSPGKWIRLDDTDTKTDVVHTTRPGCCLDRDAWMEQVEEPGMKQGRSMDLSLVWTKRNLNL
eukprot:scaffold967_cov321-Pavlova_lutheri.AAC.27